MRLLLSFIPLFLLLTNSIQAQNIFEFSGSMGEESGTNVRITIEIQNLDFEYETTIVGSYSFNNGNKQRAQGYIRHSSTSAEEYKQRGGQTKLKFYNPETYSTFFFYYNEPIQYLDYIEGTYNEYDDIDEALKEKAKKTITVYLKALNPTKKGGAIEENDLSSSTENTSSNKLCLKGNDVGENEYVDLGLPSGTYWNAKSEGKLYDYDSAIKLFGQGMPSLEQFDELVQYCSWTWIGNGYKVLGSNGNSIILSAEGWRNEHGRVTLVGTDGGYWSSKSDGSDKAWYLNFSSSFVRKQSYSRMSGLSVCLVQRGPNISDNVLLDKNDIIVDEEYQYKEQNIIEDNNVAKDLNSLSLTLSEANSDKANKKIFKSKNNSNVFWLEIILAVIILLGWLVKYIYLNVFLPSSRKCKNCGKDDAMIILDENYEDQMGGYIKIRQTRKCKFCGYEETVLVNRGHNIFN